jgi:hypothetical protein
MTLTPEERAAMAHAVGMDQVHGVKRNYYAADATQMPMWDSLCQRGFAKLFGRPAPGFEDTFYTLTPEGYAALKAAMEEVA